MNALIRTICLSTMLLCTALPIGGARENPVRVNVVVGPAAPALERFAADELCGYLNKLFGIQTQPTSSISPTSDTLFLVGGPETNPAVKQATVGQPFPRISDQGIVLRRAEFQKRPTLIVGGGSPRATLWAVYELAERWGVRYMLQGDVLPKRSPFHLPDLDVVMEPTLRNRQWRVINEFPMAPESWGLGEYRRVFDQLAKLKFNRIYFNIFNGQPFLDYEVRGIRRQSATLWYGWRYPITPDMPGRSIFPNEDEFWNPDLPRRGTPYKEFVAAGIQFIHTLMDYAHRRGMHCVISASVSDFPAEFAPLLKNPKRINQTGTETIVPGEETGLDDPGFIELATAVIQATVNTYPEADAVVFEMPEWREYVGRYSDAWEALDNKYRVSEARKLSDVLAAAERRVLYPGGPKRAVDEAKGDLVALRFYDRLVNELGVFKGTSRPDMRIIYSSVAEELLSVLGRILRPGSEGLVFIDYTPLRVLRRRQVLNTAPTGEIPVNLIYTLTDDNIGVLPQLTTDSLYELTKDLRQNRWAGFSTRYFNVSEQDPNIASLARISWDAKATPEGVDRDLMRAVCGEGCVEDMLTVFREVESATVGLEWHGLGLTFPVSGMLKQHWRPYSLPAEIREVRRSYERALEAARRAQAKTTPQGRSYVDFWVGRLEFGIGYLDMLEAVRSAAIAEAANDRKEALGEAEKALRLCRQAVEAYARVARDQSDRGAIAATNEYVYRFLKAKVTELSQ